MKFFVVLIDKEIHKHHIPLYIFFDPRSRYRSSIYRARNDNIDKRERERTLTAERKTITMNEERWLNRQ